MLQSSVSFCQLEIITVSFCQPEIITPLSPIFLNTHNLCHKGLSEQAHMSPEKKSLCKKKSFPITKKSLLCSDCQTDIFLCHVVLIVWPAWIKSDNAQRGRHVTVFFQQSALCQPLRNTLSQFGQIRVTKSAKYSMKRSGLDFPRDAVHKLYLHPIQYQPFQ